MRKILPLLVAITMMGQFMNAQNVRYVDEVFTDVVRISNHVYSINYTLLTGTAVPDTLRVDFYLPAGDTCTSRPLAVILPTGTFLPRGFIAPTGDKGDYANVQVATRLAKQGYVAASIEYRLGWNPLAQDVTVRRSTIINAAYRGIQDLYAFLRYMNKTVVDSNNIYGIDTSRIAIFGIGTGAFVGLNAAVLQQDEIYIDKFVNPGTGIPYVDSLKTGDLHGLKAAPENLVNHAGYNDAFHFAFGLDGAVGDASWLDDGNSVPIVVGGNVNHPTTPYGIDLQTGQINCDMPVSAAGQFVVNVGGSVCIASRAAALGINDPLNKGNYTDPVSEALRNDENGFNLEHLWPINQPGQQTGPWEYWDSTFWKQVPHPFGGTIHSNAILSNPDMGFDKANRYIDTALWFFSPRAFAALKLGEVVCNCENVVADPNVYMVTDFECQRNFSFGAGNDRLMIMDNPDKESGNSSEKVGAYLEPANDAFAALCVNFGGPIDLSKFNIFKFDVNSPAAGVPFLVKLEGGSSPGAEVWVNTTTANTWETITVDFSSQASANHERICIFPNGGQNSPSEDTYLLDNLRFEFETRYIDEVFDEVVKVENRVYSINFTLLTGVAVRDTLRVDFYLPANDTCTLRPLAVILPTGTFLPRGFIAPTGDKGDYANVQIATRLAKQGYVAASMEYRLGWNPLAQDVTVRRSTIINAAYRGIQDLYAFLRYVNKTVVDSNNIYGIDTSKVAVFGIGTGAFVGLNAAVLQQDEIYIDKFVNPGTGIPYVDTLVTGDLHGEKAATQNLSNHAGYNDAFHFAFGLDGAVGDASWLDDGNSVPLVVGGNVTHPTTPYGIDLVTGEINCDMPVSAAGQFVVNVGGSVCIASKANSLGINDPLNKVDYTDPVSEVLRNAENGFNLEHLWPINQPGPQTGPWEYWDSTFWKQVPHPFGGTIHSNAILTNPDMGFDKADRYIDTAIWFFSPRAFTALKLNDVVCSCEGVVPDPDITLITDFECQRNFTFGAGSDRLMIMDNPDKEAANSSEKVGAYLEPANDHWAPLCVIFENSIDLKERNVFQVDVNSPEAGIPFLLKLEGGSSPAYEVWVNTTVADTWETLVADFSSQKCEDHSRICLFPNGGQNSPEEVTYLLDNLKIVSSGDTCKVGIFNPIVATLNISPNPVDNILYIRNPGDAVHFRMLNALGQQVLELTSTGEQTVPMHVNHLNPGMYMIGAYNSKGRLVANARIVKN